MSASPLLKSYPFLPVSIARGKGSYVIDEHGVEYLDMYAGHAVCSTGHCHPHVVRAIQKQAETLIFYSNVLSLPIREEAARRLTAHAPTGFSSVFFVNSGAEANENALKLARRFTGRQKIVAMEAGFHGRTVGALSVTGNPKTREQGAPLVPGVEFVPFGQPVALDDDVAAVILEPIQSMAGVTTADSEYFAGLRKQCDAVGAVLIFDEVQTGMGRCGEMFFAGHYSVEPDLITTAKGIASGFPLSAVLVRDRIAETVEYGEYGATFGGGPLAMAALIATLDVLEEEGFLAGVRETGAWLAEQLTRLPDVVEVRGQGFLLGVKTRFEAKRAQAALLEEKILVGGSGDKHVFRLLPPLTLSRSEATKFLAGFERASRRLAEVVDEPK